MNKTKAKYLEGSEGVKEVTRMFDNPKIKILLISNYGLDGYVVWYREKGK